MRDLRDYCNWWKTRRSQIGTLIMLAGLIIWMNVALLQAERNYRGVLVELRRNYSQQEANRERQFSYLLKGLELRLSRLDEKTVEELKQQEEIRELLNSIVNVASKGQQQPAPTPTQQQRP